MFLEVRICSARLLSASSAQLFGASSHVFGDIIKKLGQNSAKQYLEKMAGS